PADKARWSGFNELSDYNFLLLREILESAARPGRPASHPTPRRQVGDFYGSAVNREQREKRGFTPLEPDLVAIRRLASARSVVDLVARFHRRGIPGLFSAYVAPDEKESSIYALYLTQGGLSLPDRDYYLTEGFAKVREGYAIHLRRALGLLGIPAARIESEAESIARLETELAKSSRSRVDLRDPYKNYNRFTPAEFAKRYPHLRPADYLARLGAGSPPYVVVGQPEFFDCVDRLLRTVRVADWKSYLRWNLVRSSADELHGAIENEHFDFFRRQILGQQEPEPEWKRAAITIDASIGEALGRLYVQRHFPKEAEARMAELVADLRSVFQGRLLRLPWMTDATKEKALQKFGRFSAKIGHPDRYRDYSSVRVSRSDLLGNVRTHGYDDQGRKYDADGNLKDWWTDADAKEFESRARQIVEQFNRFEPLPNAHVNGELTAGENIADLGGLRIAYEALRRRLDDGRTPRRPIDGFTPEQRFFLSYGQIWRMNVREPEARRLLTIDPHSPGRYRVNGPLANLPEFFDAWNVPEGSPMRQPEEHRVEIW
ncbi:MAG: M13 family metallopeptidase, partial [Thermoplasmatales archaeon]|nr:M13 family metallopeptidase [Thermoplasmatales archaeon]